MAAKHVHTTICTGVFFKADTDKDLHDASVCLRVWWVNVLLASPICLAYDGFIKFLTSSPSWSMGILMH